MGSNPRLLTYYVYDADNKLVVTHKVYSQWANVIIDIYLKWHKNECPYTLYLELNGKRIKIRQNEFKL